ncbi:MAG TPA: hypothetical protein VHY22_07850 [Chthoniobacteraceae bacterium]|nr:hypothetical protein [Chthoniobacteraceae bacterium]
MDDRAMNAGFAPQPIYCESILNQQSRVRRRRLRNAFLAVVENIDVAGKAGAVLVERSRSRNVAFRVSVRGQKPQNFGLKFRERHDTPPRSEPPGEAFSCCLLAAAFPRQQEPE